MVLDDLGMNDFKSITGTSSEMPKRSCPKVTHFLPPSVV